VVEGLEDADTTYHFVVRARDAAGNSDDNTEEIDGTTGPDTTAPVFSGCSLATSTGATSAFLSWKPARDDVTPADHILYAVYVAEQPGEQDFTLPAAEVLGGSGVEVPDLNPSTTYYFVCRAQDATKNEDSNVAERQARTEERRAELGRCHGRQEHAGSDQLRRIPVHHDGRAGVRHADRDVGSRSHLDRAQQLGAEQKLVLGRACARQGGQPD
jgi:hypothetical protein